MIDLQELSNVISVASSMEKMIKDFEIDLYRSSHKIILDYNSKDKIFVYKRYDAHKDFRLISIGVGLTIFIAWASRVYENDDTQKFNELKGKYENVLDIVNVRLQIAGS